MCGGSCGSGRGWEDRRHSRSPSAGWAVSARSQAAHGREGRSGPQPPLGWAGEGPWGWLRRRARLVVVICGIWPVRRPPPRLSRAPPTLGTARWAVMLLAVPPPALYWWLTRRGCCCGDQGGRNLRPRRDRRRFGVRSAAFSPPPAPAGRPRPPARNGFRFLRLHGRWAGSDRCGGAPSVPAHGAIIIAGSTACLVCLVQVDEVGGGDLRRMADFSGAPHPDMEGAAALQRPGGVLLPAVLPGWALGRAWARWRADRGTDAGRRRSAFRPRRCHPTCCPAPAGTGAGALHWQPGGPAAGTGCEPSAQVP